MKSIKKMISLALIITLLCGLSMTASAAPAAPAVAASCLITDGNTITFTGNLSSVPASDDGVIYLYEMTCFEYAIAPGRAAIASAPASQNPVFTVSLTNESGGSRLYNKFAMAVKKGGVLTIVGEPQYITNPEALATHTRPKANHSLKGLQGQTFTNLWMNGEPSEGIASTLPRTVQLMNPGTNQTITNPLGRNGVPDPAYVAPNGYYMLNANDQAGVDAIVKEVSYYAANSNAEVFFVGNEVNVRSWNYMVWTGNWDEYMRQYTQVFRVIYNAVKSQNANAEVAVVIDSQWDRNRAPGHPEYTQYMDGKDFLIAFNNSIRAGGNIDWGVAAHPHTAPLTYAKFWDMSGQPNGAYYAAQISGNKMVSFQNLSVITNFLQSPEFLKRDGTMRYFTIGELGVASGQGADVQAAAMAAAYAAAMLNGHVDEITFLTGPQVGVDYSYVGQSSAVFDGLGGADTNSYLEWAKAYIGISDWSQILR